MASIRASSTCHCAEINIANNAELRANLQSILATIRESRPKNTTGAYKSKQKKFKASKLACWQADRRQANLIDSSYSARRSNTRMMILLQRISCFSFL